MATISRVVMEVRSDPTALRSDLEQHLADIQRFSTQATQASQQAVAPSGATQSLSALRQQLAEHENGLKRVRDQIHQVNGAYEGAAVGGERAGHRVLSAMERLSFATSGAKVNAEGLTSAFSSLAIGAAQISGSALLAEWAIGLGAIVALAGVLIERFHQANEEQTRGRNSQT